MVPRLSVVMPVHNAADYLDSSIPSILGQDFADFELVIRDDGSTDDSHARLLAWSAKDRRIRLFAGGQLGPAGAGNFIVGQARAPLIARMDADDIARPDRLRRQVEAMAAAPDIAMLGTGFDVIDRCGDPLRPSNAWRLFKSSYSAPFPHSSVLFRREIFDQAGGYRASCEYWEDLDFFLRVAAIGRVAVLPGKLVSYRLAHTSSRLVSDRTLVEQALHRRCECLDAHRRTGDYRHLLERLQTEQPAHKLHPKALLFLSSLELWSDRRCDVLGPVLRRARLGWDLRSAALLLWALWATISPASLRLALSAAVSVGNLAAKRAMRAGQIRDWRPKIAPARKTIRRLALRRRAEPTWLASAGPQALS